MLHHGVWAIPFDPFAVAASAAGALIAMLVHRNVCRRPGLASRGIGSGPSAVDRLRSGTSNGSRPAQACAHDRTRGSALLGVQTSRR